MKAFNLRLGLVTAGFALAAAPVFAQRPSESGSSPAAERPTAVERPATNGGPAGGGSGSSNAGSVATSAGSSVGSGVSSSSPSSTMISSPGFGNGGRPAFREEAPQHRGGSSGGQHAASGGQRGGSGQASPRGGSQASPRSGGGESRGGERAVPRGSNSSTDGGANRINSPNSAGRNANPSTNGASDDRAIPSWARPRGDRPVTDSAVARTVPRGGVDSGFYGRYYDPFFGGFYGYYPGYFGANRGFGYYGYYDPFFGPFPYNPYALGYGFGLGFPMMYDPYYGAGGDYWSTYGTSQSGYDGSEGRLRLKIKPRDAKVYVDGYFVGTVDDMDGMFQKFPLTPGRHRVEVKADGYQPETFDALITSGQTVTFEGQLKKIQ